MMGQLTTTQLITSYCNSSPMTKVAFKQTNSSTVIINNTPKPDFKQIAIDFQITKPEVIDFKTANKK